MNADEIERGQRVYDRENNTTLVVVNTGLGEASDCTFKGQSVYRNNKSYPPSDEVIEAVYNSSALNCSSIESGFSIDDILEYERKYNVHIDRYYFPVSRLRPNSME